MKLDISTMTLGDLETFEEVAGVPFTSLANIGTDNELPLKVIMALLYVVERKTNPAITLDDIRQMPLTALQFDVVDSTANPQSGG